MHIVFHAAHLIACTVECTLHSRAMRCYCHHQRTWQPVTRTSETKINKTCRQNKYRQSLRGMSRGSCWLNYAHIFLERTTKHQGLSAGSLGLPLGHSSVTLRLISCHDGMSGFTKLQMCTVSAFDPDFSCKLVLQKIQAYTNLYLPTHRFKMR